MEYDIKKLKRSLRHIWSRSGITQKELAFIIGINEKTLNNILNPDSVNLKDEPIYPDLKTLIKFCDYFDCDLDALFGNLDYSRHDNKFICEYTGLSEQAVEQLHSSSYSPHKQLIDWLLTGSELLDHIEKYVTICHSSEDILSSAGFPDNIKVLGVNISETVLKQAVLNMIQSDLEGCDRILTLDWEDTIQDDMETAVSPAPDPTQEP